MLQKYLGSDDAANSRRAGLIDSNNSIRTLVGEHHDTQWPSKGLMASDIQIECVIHKTNTYILLVEYENTMIIKSNNNICLPMYRRTICVLCIAQLSSIRRTYAGHHPHNNCSHEHSRHLDTIVYKEGEGVTTSRILWEEERHHAYRWAMILFIVMSIRVG